MTKPTHSVETRFQPDMVGSKGVTRSNSLFSQSESCSTEIHVLLSQRVGGSSLPSKHFKHNEAALQEVLDSKDEAPSSIFTKAMVRQS